VNAFEDSECYLHATGRTFVPFIRRDLYDKLVAAAPNGNAHPTSPAASGSSGAAGAHPPGGSSPNLPGTWQEISLGDLVVAQEGPEDGWYEAIVAEVNGDMLTVRWRDYPHERRVVRHRQRLGLRCRCALAKRFKNCLANFLTQIDAGGCAVYLWDDPTAPAVCLVTRQGRLGWSLSEPLGPENAKLDRKQLQTITTAFAEAGIPQYSAIRSIECILESDTTLPRTRRQRRLAWEQRLWELEEATWIQDVMR
jgi:hypothetical protein